jgi:uncharacterized protein
VNATNSHRSVAAASRSAPTPTPAVASESCIYEGVVRHRRFAPIRHEFRYRIFMMYLDLAELPDLFRGRWFWSADRPALARFRRSDYLGDPSVPLDQAVRDLVESRLGRRPAGPIRMLTNLRYYGHCFNPVTFYYCFATNRPHPSDAIALPLDTIVSEITNTPWRERHAYVHDCLASSAPTHHRFDLPKRFHVSPFIPMDIRYDWSFGVPGHELFVHMNNFPIAAAQHPEPGPDSEPRPSVDRSRARPRVPRLFDATLTLHRREITTASLARMLCLYPAHTVGVLSAIYWQAFKLRVKGAPFHAHPGNTTV